jgi:hypothetical protein
MIPTTPTLPIARIYRIPMLKLEITIPSENGTPIKVKNAAVNIINGANIISLLSASAGIVSSLTLVFYIF